MRLVLKVWRQRSAGEPGRFERYDVDGLDPEMRFLDMLDRLNQRLLASRAAPIRFGHGCREGICGECGFLIDGRPHGPAGGTAVCQLPLRTFADGQFLTLEPFRSPAFAVVRDLAVDRQALARIAEAGSSVTPSTRLATAQPGGGEFCIACGACVAACPNGSAILFAAAMFSNLARIHPDPADQGRRAIRMVTQMDAEGFGSCSDHRECEAGCPKDLSVDLIARLNRACLAAVLVHGAPV